MHNYFITLQDALFPAQCRWCGRTLSAPWERICPDCARKSRAVPSGGCAKCGENLHGAKGCLCFDCLRSDRGFDSAGALFRYDAGPGSMLLLRFKFGRDRRAGADLARLLEEPLRAVLSEASESLVVPVPVSSGTLKKRGFNQVEEVLTACSVSYTGLLERTGDKRHQVALGAEERAALVHGQYSVREDARKVLSGRQVVLVDDVLTTGSTMGEAARVLREAGAARVTGIAFFRESLF